LFFEEKAELTDEVKQVAPVGLEFSFKYKAKGDAATLDGLKGDKTDALRAHLEGDYEQKK
jgi:hypothetical protein